MSFGDKLNHIQSKTDAGLKRRRSNFYNSPASPDKLIQLFNRKFKEYNYGEPPLVNQQIRGMLNGFIKICRSSHWPERKIYNTIEQLVEHWDFIKAREHHTLKNNKKAAIGDRPSLIEFLICRETMLTAVKSAKTDNVEAPQAEVVITKQHVTKRFAPSEEEMQAEMERQMEDYL